MFKEQALIPEGYFQILGGNLNYPKETTERVLKFKEELEEKRRYVKFTTFESKVDEMIIINGLKVFSFCEHHLLPFFGYCSIGYIPNGKILGLSKFQRLVDKFASKPTVQESLTQELADQLTSFFAGEYDLKGIGIAMTCIHTCMYGRGVNTSTITVNSQVLMGKIKDEREARSEFLNRINHENILR